MRTFGKARGGGRRSASRATAPLLIAVLSTAEADFRLGLVNVSSRGVRLTAPDLPAEGEPVIFQAEGVQSFGRVVWNRKGQCGVAFETPITADYVELLRDKADLTVAA